MQAAIVAVGSELLGADRVDTNSLGLSDVLRTFGVGLRSKEVVGDSVSQIASSLRRLSGEVDLVIVTGGLGPTADDVTREAIAEAFAMQLSTEPRVMEAMEVRFANSGITMPEVNRRQALVPERADWIANPRGTAPGLVLEEKGCTLYFFPGVPRELDGMVESHLKPWLRSRSQAVGIEQRALRVACLAESRVEELIAPAYEEMGRESITVLAKPGDIEIRVSAKGTQEARSVQLDAMVERLRELVGGAAYSVEAGDDLETVVGRLLKQQSATVATAESCTGGLVSERLTNVAGSSTYFVGGVVAYADEVKRTVLGVDGALIESHGAVSREVAIAMSEGAVKRFGTDYGIGITGVAGPGGGSESKPVGAVHIAIARRGREALHHGARFPGDRQRVRGLSSQWALDLLRRDLLGIGAAS